MTTRCAVLGYPVEHSRSPAMQNAAFRALGLDWSYEAIAVEPERFSEVVRDLVEQGYAGANVTIPHKLRALELADVVSDVARAVGAANTLSFEAGSVAAHNTDVEGFLGALAEAVPEGPRGMRGLVLGAGGAEPPPRPRSGSGGGPRAPEGEGGAARGARPAGLPRRPDRQRHLRGDGPPRAPRDVRSVGFQGTAHFSR